MSFCRLVQTAAAAAFVFWFVRFLLPGRCEELAVENDMLLEEAVERDRAQGAGGYRSGADLAKVSAMIKAKKTMMKHARRSKRGARRCLGMPTALSLSFSLRGVRSRAQGHNMLVAHAPLLYLFSP
jgi:hypothetical protein